MLAAGGNQTAGELSRAIEKPQQGAPRPGPGTASSPAQLGGELPRRRLEKRVRRSSSSASRPTCRRSGAERWRGKKVTAAVTAREAGAVHARRRPAGAARPARRPARFTARPTRSVYLDLDFFRELQQRFHARGGDFAEAYVVAHEYGHHVQDVLGTDAASARAAAGAARPARRAVGAAGAAGRLLRRRLGPLGVQRRERSSSTEIADALDAAAAVGDDRIQKEVRGRVTPETFTHGSSAARQKWFTTGMRTGDPARLRHLQRRRAVIAADRGTQVNPAPGRHVKKIAALTGSSRPRSSPRGRPTSGSRWSPRCGGRCARRPRPCGGQEAAAGSTRRRRPDRR